MNAFASISATTETSASALLHANTIRWLQEIPEFLAHAVEALHEEGEEDGAKGMVKRAIRDLTRILEKIDEPTPVYVQPDPDPLYLSAGLPDGYDTHLGFLTTRPSTMVLRMTRPTTRENSTLAQFRRRVPSDVADRARGQAFFVEVPGTAGGPAVRFETKAGVYVKFSLRTKDPAVAAYRASVANSQADRWFDALRAGPSGLSHKTLVALSGEVYRLYVERFEDDPGSADDWAALKAFNRAAREGRILNAVPALRPGELDAAITAHETFGPDLTAGVDALPRASSSPRRPGAAFRPPDELGPAKALPADRR